MASGPPGQAPVREAGRGRARLHRARVRGPRRGERARRPRRAAPDGALRGSGRVFRLLAELSAIEPADGPTDLVAAARHAAAQLPGRGVVILLSDLLDPAADKVIRELAATALGARRPPRPLARTSSTRRSRATCGSSTRRPATGVDVTADLATIDAYKRAPRRLEGRASPTSPRKRGATYVDLSTDVPLARPGLRRAAPPPASWPERAMRPRCRSRPRSRCSASCSSRPSSRCTCSSCAATRRSSPRRCSGSGSSPTSRPTRPWQRLRRSLLLLLQLLLVVILALLAARPFLERPAGLARDLVLIVDTSASMGATDVAPGPADRRQGRRHRGAQGPPGRRQGQRHRGRPDAPGSSSNGTTDLGRVRQAIDGDPRRRRSRGDLATPSSSPSSSPSQSGDAEVLVATDAALAVDADGQGRRPGPGPPGRRANGTNQAIVALAVRTAPSAVTRSVFVSVANLDLEQADAAGRDLGRRPPARDPDDRPRRPAAGRRDHRRRAAPTSATIEVRLVAARRRPRPARRTSSPPTTGPGRSSRRDRTATILARRRRAIRTSRPRCPTCPNSRAVRRDARRIPGRRRAHGRHGRGTWSSSRATVPATPAARRRSWRSRRRARAPLGEVGGTLKDPGIGSLGTDEPILRYVDLSTTHIAEAQQLTLPAVGADGDPGPEGRAAALLRHPGRAARPRSSPSSRASPTCRSRSRSRSCSRT